MSPTTNSSSHAGRRRRFGLVATALLVIGALLVPSLAGAQQTGPTGDQYDPAPERIEQAVVTDEAAPAAAAPAEADRVVAALPFTGLDLALLAFAAVLLGATGVALRRFTRTSRDSS